MKMKKSNPFCNRMCVLLLVVLTTSIALAQKKSKTDSIIHFASLEIYKDPDNAIRIANGIIEGNYNTHSGIQTYFGVPFAKPPIGNLRWKAPQPLDKSALKRSRYHDPGPIPHPDQLRPVSGSNF